MRRPAPALPISPQQLKHFAAATVAITVLLALFAGGDDTGLAAEIQAREARNQLIEAETGKVGTKQLKSKLKLKEGSNSQFAFSEGGDVASSGSEWGSGGGGGGVARPVNHTVSDAASMQRRLPKTPGQTAEIAGPEGVPDGAKPADQRAKKKPNNAAERRPFTEPSEADLAKALEASRQRSGHEDNASDQ